jgi:hypothetical protein
MNIYIFSMFLKLLFLENIEIFIYQKNNKSIYNVI